MKKIIFLFLSINLLSLNFQKAYSGELNSEYLDIYYQGIDFLNKGKFSEAEEKCDKLIEISPERKLGYLCKEIALGFSGKRSKREALKNFTMAIEKDSEFYEAYYWRGVLQFSMRRKKLSHIDRTACTDIKKAYLNNFPYALDYVNKNKAFLRRDNCTGFYKK